MPEDAQERCVEMVLKSMEARRKAEALDDRERPPATYYPGEFYCLTAARFFALSTRLDAR